MSNKKTLRISTFGSRATAVVSLALTLTLFGLAALTLISARSAMENVRTNIMVLVKVSPDAELAQLNALKQHLSNANYLSSHTYTDADAILAQEVEYIGEDVAALLDENPYNSEFELHLKPAWANPDSINRITAQLAKFPAIEEISSDVTSLADADTIFEKITIVLLCIAGALLLISFVLINNTVSLSIYSRRFIIHTMKLVGAAPSFIRKPFVGSGAVNGLIAGIAATAVLACLQLWISEIAPDIATTLPWTQTAVVYASLPVLGMILCTLAAWYAATRYLRRNYDRLFRR
ncbi:MAG: permease-like cell division protein FtsX [Bacteroidales bacterium]|nr:permease-like cell division protein FtsX [Bacteroidales bacterium]